ncbi:MAG: response regulator transcription factor [Pseudomonadota bacterium]|nr:response regulator transcription factor [Pseudomonadota bacterium]
MTEVKKILIVNVDKDLQEMLIEQLETHAEFMVQGVDNEQDALSKTSAQYYDIILMDIELGDVDGRDVCRKMREKGVNSPIVMMSKSENDTDTILGFDAGANDHVVKPFKINALLARLRARIREAAHSQHAVFQIGPYSFRPLDKLMVNNFSKQRIRLTEKETAIVKFLYLAGDHVVSRDTLLEEVWGYNSGVTTHTLETHVYRLRQKIEEAPSNALILITEPKGYRLNR